MDDGRGSSVLKQTQAEASIGLGIIQPCWSRPALLRVVPRCVRLAQGLCVLSPHRRRAHRSKRQTDRLHRFP
jgi:hypothetical protein